MVYTEKKIRNENTYFYRVLSVRNKNKVTKKRVYLGVNLSKKKLLKKEKEADTNLIKITANLALEKIKPDILSILKKYKIKKAGIFGSYARGEQTKESDIDILIQPPKNIGFGFAGIQLELQEKLKKNVDLVSYNGLSPYLKNKILNQEVKLI